MAGTALAVVVAKLGGQLLPERGDGWVNRFRIRSETSNRLYVVSQNTRRGFRWECSCPGWRTRRRCKHLDAIAPALARLGAAPQPAAAGLPAPKEET